MASRISENYAKSFFKCRDRTFSKITKREIKIDTITKDKNKVICVMYYIDNELVVCGSKLSKNDNFNKIVIRIPFIDTMLIDSIKALEFDLERLNGALFLCNQKVLNGKAYIIPHKQDNQELKEFSYKVNDIIEYVTNI